MLDKKLEDKWFSSMFDDSVQFTLGELLELAKYGYGEKESKSSSSFDGNSCTQSGQRISTFVPNSGHNYRNSYAQSGRRFL